jgi:hypothetical protein
MIRRRAPSQHTKPRVSGPRAAAQALAAPGAARGRDGASLAVCCDQEVIMSLTTIVVIVLIVMLLGGGGYYWRR